MYKNFGHNLEVFSKDGIIPNLPFLEIKDKILQKDFVLNIVFLKEKEIQELNIKYRNKNYTPNVLTFPYDEISGEIFICKKIARSQYKSFNLNYNSFLKLLIIHGCLHLDGFDHDNEDSLQKMSNKEQAILSLFVNKK